MNPCIKFCLPLLLAALGLMLAGRVTAQTFTTLHSFDGSNGANPNGSLVLSGSTLYGTTVDGGSSGQGTVFAINTNGTGYTNLYIFTGGNDGGNPYGGLVLSGNVLYGTTQSGGSSGNGTVFAVNTNGTGFTNLHSLDGYKDGARPFAGLVISNNTLYGTAYIGGDSTNGTLFKVNSDSTSFTILHTFTEFPDGGLPQAGLILSGDTLYGTAADGGSFGSGTVFRVNTDGTVYGVVHSFTAYDPYNNGTNSDGDYPTSSLTLSGDTLYGTTQSGGSSGHGTVFAVNADGTGLTNLHSFAAGSGPWFSFTNSDGATPIAGLILSGNTLYGTTADGGSAGNGTVFAINTNGTGFTVLHTFSGSSGGGSPQAGLILSGNTLYGTSKHGGSYGGGTVFSLSFSPQLTIILSDINVILTWPTNYAGFDYTGFTLQSTTNLLLPVWTTNSPSPVVVNGQNTVTNPSGTQQLYRLSQ